jgi:hypothetical protein
MPLMIIGILYPQKFLIYVKEKGKKERMERRVVYIEMNYSYEST